eukprot:TRINITY_DN92604_c0_g1_i1.p1 TRINITY_DN92604_c0_g1~~TRINITY_DN92604_c0_g1_i1.p1  ORF type:complete len:359 (-),score=57.20 TRINITY_DN92604_c0_g1_i1:38-1114(-)
MDSILEVDSLTVVNIVDNETDSLSSPCACCAEPAKSGVKFCGEFGKNAKRHKGINFDKACSAGHGLSLLLEAEAGGTKHTMLFDAGPNARLWQENAEKLEIELASIETIMLSHYHIDHSGGFRSAVPLIAEARKKAGSPQVCIDLSPDRPASRGMRMPEGSMFPMQPENPSFQELQSTGARVEQHADGHGALDGFFYVSGKIPRTTSYEKGLVNHWRLDRPDGDWREDPLVEDERYAAVKIKGRGLVVFSACSHAGIVNVLRDARAKAGGAPVLAVVGGFHLAGAGVEGRIPETVADLVQLEPKVLLAGHCTGWRAKMALAAVFPDGFQPCVVGSTYVFSKPEAELGTGEARKNGVFE